MNETKWPSLKLTGKSEDLWTAETIRERMDGLFGGSGFSVVLCDCYDSMRTLPMNYCDMPSRIRRKGPQKGLPYLFWKYLSSIAISSHEKGEKGYGIMQGKEKGGLLTLMFCRSLERATVKPQFWNVVLPEIAGNCLHFAAPDSQKHLSPLNQKVKIFHEKDSYHSDFYLVIS